VKRRVLIIDLDCPFGINHYDLVDCEECQTQEILLDKTLQTISPQGSSTVTWTTISTSSTTEWGGMGDSSTSVFYLDNGTDLTTMTNLKMLFTTDSTTSTVMSKI